MVVPIDLLIDGERFLKVLSRCRVISLLAEHCPNIVQGLGCVGVLIPQYFALNSERFIVVFFSGG